MNHHETTAVSSLIHDLRQVRLGDHLEAVSQAVVHHQGIVEDIAPDAGVVWVRDTGIGERMMLASDTFKLRIC
ncbi:hypothetical protein [Kocuria nitroreducens]|uniref:hypothetical protein n=1 Tax=Kocuria nitroreducens TaxID=3058914 RepID=UPI0036DC7BA8